MTEYRFYASEACEEGELITAEKILCEIHDSMCMCGAGPDECRTEGVQGTILEAAQGIIAHGKWSTDFEDGWLKVETIDDPSADQKPPVHAFELRITIGANESPYVARALAEIGETIERSGVAGAMSGGWDGSWSIDVSKRDVTPDQYRQELEEWRQRRFDGS